MRVARAPGPAAQIGRVGGAERLAAGLAEPDHGGAGAGGALEGGGGESGWGGGGGEEGRGWGRGRRAAAAGAGPAGRGELGQRGARAGAAEAAVAAVEHGGRGWFECAVPAHNCSAALAFSDHVAGTFAYPPARHAAYWGAGSAAGPRLVRYAHALGQLGARRGIFVDAAEALVDKLFAVLEQISAELPAGPGEVVQGVQIEQAGQLRDYGITAQCG